MNAFTRAHIVVLGTGFGALSTVRAVRAGGCTDPITMIGPRAELHYLPGTIWIPSGLRTRADLVVPLGNFFQRMNVQHHHASVTGLSAGSWENIIPVVQYLVQKEMTGG